MTDTQNTYGSVLVKADAILKVIAEQPEITLTKIARDTNFTRPTTLKILDTLQKLNYVNKDQSHKTYKIGSAFLKYNEAFLQNFDIVRFCDPYLEKLRDKFGETVHFGDLDRGELIYLNKFSGKKAITVMASRIGMHAPLYATAMGKSILSTFSSQKLQQYFQHSTLTGFTKNTITDPRILNKQISEIKEKKVSFDDSEYEKDVYCIATSIVYKQKLFGAFSISVPKYRINSDLITAMTTEILQTRKQIETAF